MLVLILPCHPHSKNASTTMYKLHDKLLYINLIISYLNSHWKDNNWKSSQGYHQVHIGRYCGKVTIHNYEKDLHLWILTCVNPFNKNAHLVSCRKHKGKKKWHLGPTTCVAMWVAWTTRQKRWFWFYNIFGLCGGCKNHKWHIKLIMQHA